MMEEINIEDHLNLVPFVIHNKMSWLINYYEFEDLMAEGYASLVKAKQTFNSNFNFKFTTYASKCIFQYLMDYHRKEAKAKGYSSYVYKKKKPSKMQIKDVDMDKLLPTLTVVHSYLVRKKYKVGIS